MKKITFGILLLIVIFLPFVFAEQPNSNDTRFEHVSPINITSDEVTTIIDPAIIKDYEPDSKLFDNTNKKENKITFTRGENITMSYESPCGYPTSIRGLIVGDLNIIRNFSSSTPIEMVNWTAGKQFYNNSSLPPESLETLTIPKDIPISSPSEKNSYGNKLLFIINCGDESTYYYTTEIQIK